MEEGGLVWPCWKHTFCVQYGHDVCNAASLRTWHDSGEMVRGMSLDVPLNSSDDDPSRDSSLPAAVPSPPQHLQSAALYSNERYEI